MRRRMSIQVQGEGYRLRLQPGETAAFGTAEDTEVPFTRGTPIRKRHAELRWRDDRWVLADLDHRTGILWADERVTEVELTQPETVRLGGPSGPVVALTPLPRPRRRWGRWPLAAAAGVLVVALVAGFLVARQPEVDHEPFPIDSCIDANGNWSAGERAVRPAGRLVDCEDRFDYKVVAVIPVPTPRLTSFNTGKLLERRALELSEGRCPPASWPALGAPELGRTYEVYCVQDSIYTIDDAVLKEGRDFQCVLRADGKPRLATPCGLRHDYIISELQPLAAAPFPGDEEMREIGEDGCAASNGEVPAVPVVPTERTWEQGDHRLLCLQQDNIQYEEVIDWAGRDLPRYWGERLPDVSPELSAVTVLEEEDYDPESPPTCGDFKLRDNAIYCPDGDYIAWDPEWFKRRFYDQYGDTAVAIVLAHEWGHAIQRRLGLSRRDQIRKEYQADCFAGAWLRDFYGRDANVGPGEAFASGTDRNKAVQAIVEISDMSSFSAENLAEGAHGDAIERTRNLLRGFDNDWRDCLELLPA